MLEEPPEAVEKGPAQLGWGAWWEEGDSACPAGSVLRQIEGPPARSIVCARAVPGQDGDKLGQPQGRGTSFHAGGGKAAEALAQARGEDWGEIPADGRANRTQLLAVANAHLDGLDDEIVERSFVVDESRGAVGVFARVGDVSGPAVSYTLRIEDGAVRYVHAGVSVD
jgi:hypothetical protein